MGIAENRPGCRAIRLSGQGLRANLIAGPHYSPVIYCATKTGEKVGIELMRPISKVPGTLSAGVTRPLQYPLLMGWAC